MTYRTVIIDDDQTAINAFQNLVSQFDFPVELVGAARSLEEAMPLLNRTQPDLLFLDIELKNENGFDLLDMWEPGPTKVVFCTGYDQYARKALKKGAFDYVLKPLDYREFSELFAKLRQTRPVDQPQVEVGKIVVKQVNGLHMLAYDEITHLKASGRYTEVYSQSSGSVISSKNLGLYEQELPGNIFFRPSKSLIVNRKLITGVEKRGERSFLLFGSQSLEVSDRTRKATLQMLE